MTQFRDHELEDIERAAWSDVFDAAPASLRRQLGMEVDAIDGATVLRAAGIDHVLFNRTLGLGTGGPPQARTVRRIVGAYARAGVRRYFVHLRSDDAGESRLRLEHEGLTRFHRSWVKLARGAEPPADVSTDLNVVRAEPARREEIAEILGQAFDLPDEAAGVLASLVGRAGWHVYVALDGERLAAVGGAFVRGTSANVAFAATRPEHRGRGAQGALMARRIQMALDLGCTLMTSETGEDVPGDPQHSYRNMLRHGFRPAYVRENWCPPGVSWGRSVA